MFKTRFRRLRFLTVACLMYTVQTRALAAPPAASEEQAVAQPGVGNAEPVAKDAAKTGNTSGDAVAGQPTAAPPQSSQKNAAPPAAVVQEPSQGRPIFITPGETFYFVMRLPPTLVKGGQVNIALKHAIEPEIRIALSPETPPSYVNNEYCTMVLGVPEKTAPGLYDVEIKSQTETYHSRRSVKVVDKFKSKFRFVHLSNMNIGDLTAPEFDDMLPAEINVLAPEFIVTTGNYTEWARAQDDAASWNRVLKFFEKFNAPVFMMCGSHDHESSFTQYVANKPIGTIDYGAYHGLLLLDHPGHPIDQDFAQLQWIDEDLKRNRNRQFNFLASSSDELVLFDIWRERGDLPAFLKEHKVKMFLVGGSTDWDYVEFAQKLADLKDFDYVRTHQASTCLRDRATGFSHYRVIEVDGDKTRYVYANDNGCARMQDSIPTGRLRTFFDAPNDGSSSRIGVTIQNALNQGFDNVHVWLRIAKRGGLGQPSVMPGRIEQVLDLGKYWACDAVVDVPEKGAVKLVAACDPRDISPRMPITAELEGPTDWTFMPRRTEFGLSYFQSDAPVKLTLTNRGTTKLTCWPIVRVNGSQIHRDPAACPRLPIEIGPEKSVSIPLQLNLRRVSPGEHSVQVCFLEDPISRVTTFPVTLTIQESLAKQDEGLRAP